jgi:hypothetical protein
VSVLLLGHLGDLPWSPYFVTKSPVFDVVRLFTAILPPEIGIISVLCPVTVFNPRKSFIESSCAKVQAKVRLSSKKLAPLQELVCSKLVGLGSQPSQLRSVEP